MKVNSDLNFLKKNRKVALYLIFGFLTTLVNLAVYLFSTRILLLGAVAASAAAFVLSVLFAYFTNRSLVFKSRGNAAGEIVKFFLSRLATGAADLAMVFIGVDLLCLNDIAVKIIANIIVVILNYLLSRLFVFRVKAR